MSKLYLDDASDYLKKQLECVPENFPEIEARLIESWIDFVNLNGDFDVNEVVDALKYVKSSGYAEDIIEEIIENLEYL